MSDKSPAWKKPSKVVKVLRRKKTSQASEKFTLQGTEASNKSSDSDSGPNTAPKRKNPFGFLAKKRPKLDTFASASQDIVADEPNEELQKENSQDRTENFFSALHSEQKSSSVSDVVNLPECPSADDPTKSLTSEPAKDVSEATEEQATHGSATYPCDWSLKSKLRFVSDKPFSWCCPLKSAEEAKGMEKFVKNDILDSQKSVQEDSSTQAKVDFHSCCMYWMHPHLPWLRLFPRTVPDSKIGNVTCTSRDEEVLKALQTNWAESFTSLFQQLRASLCSYFYLCAHQFTVLFWSGDMPGDVGAVLTPTTRGFRQLMQNEGIEFTMPLNKKASSNKQEKTSSKSSGAPHTNSTEKSSSECGASPSEESGGHRTAEQEEEDEETDEENTQWLENLGLDKNNFKALDPNRLKLERENWREVDERVESVVRVASIPHTQALFNLLLNSRSCVASKGVQQGLPPTLLAPRPFRGATLQSLQVRAGALRQMDKSGKGSSQCHSLELTGPILPSSHAHLISLLRQTNPECSVSFTTVDDSIPFNCAAALTSKEALCQDHELSGKEALRQLSWNADGFTWTLY